MGFTLFLISVAISFYMLIVNCNITVMIERGWHILNPIPKVRHEISISVAWLSLRGRNLSTSLAWICAAVAWFWITWMKFNQSDRLWNVNHVMAVILTRLVSLSGWLLPILIWSLSFCWSNFGSLKQNGSIWSSNH